MKKVLLSLSILFVTLFVGVSFDKVSAEKLTCKYDYRNGDVATLTIDLSNNSFSISNTNGSSWIEYPVDNYINSNYGYTANKMIENIKSNGKKCPNKFYSFDVQYGTCIGTSGCEKRIAYIFNQDVRIQSKTELNAAFGRRVAYFDDKDGKRWLFFSSDESLIATWNYRENGSSTSSFEFDFQCKHYKGLLSKSAEKKGLKYYYSEYQRKCKKNKSSSECQNLKEGYTTKLNEVKNWCSFALGQLDHDSACLNSCLSLNHDIVANDINNYSNTKTSCGASEEIIAFVYNLLKWVKYIAPVLVIILGILDFIKALAAQDDDAMKKAQGKFVKRLIAATLLFLLPLIIDYILSIFDMYDANCDVVELFK